MSEKIYALLLRLYPVRFREIYGDAALQLLRDRLRDERGFFRRLRLWLDLIGDLAVSVPLENRMASHALAAGPVTRPSGEILSFRVLQDEPPRPKAIFLASLLSLAAVGAFAIAIGHAGDYKPFRSFVTSSRPSPRLRPTAPSRPAPSSFDDGDEEAIGNANQAAAAPSLPAAALKDAKVLDATKPATMVAIDAAEIDAAEKKRVVDAAAANLKQHYFDSKLAQNMADSLLAHTKSSEDEAVKTGAGFAALLTAQMRDASHDMHLEVVYSRDVLPVQPSRTPSLEAQARYQRAMEQSNCTFAKVALLPHNIGYLKLDSFPDPAICRSTATAAMASLKDADAIIIDLRDNGGGFQGGVSMIAAYFFDRPAYLYDPREAQTEDSWTHSPVPGNRLADKPVYVLTSGSTVSAAEDFSYNLKMMRRATFIGETTQGSAHAGVFHRIDDHFGMGIPEVKVANPYATTDWEGKGIEPDVKVKLEDALSTAEKLAENQVRKR
jgi:hypothetical protein